MRRSYKYLGFGIVAGAVAPVGLFAYGFLRGRPLDSLEVLAATGMGGSVALGFAGWTIGRRDDALLARNRELRELSDRLHAQSVTDVLTGISNRRALDERLALEVARFDRYETPLSLVMMDLDHFKELNDRFGHCAGDEVLRRVAALLDGQKRTGDLVARYGGDELVAVLPHTDAHAALMWAERVRPLVAAAEIPFGGVPVQITASFGVAQASHRGETPAQLLEKADRALYEAKHLGRNRVAAHLPGQGTEGGAPGRSEAGRRQWG